MKARPDGSALFVAGLGLGIGAVLLIGAGSIAPPMFDPVGSAALPRACAVALIGLGLGTALQSALRGIPSGGAGAIRPATIGLVGLMVAYVLAMELGLGFALATILFTAAAIPLVARSRRLLIFSVPIALVLGLGAQWLFTSVFFVDLPRFG
ncbi:tripartite tricarboxylate transporter TctB family protein [Halovulum sp. GXIMD14794]|nr:tripartite tricarboxylate transporter TctB family protein [Paracoccaceae bacterium]